MSENSSTTVPHGNYSPRKEQPATDSKSSERSATRKRLSSPQPISTSGTARPSLGSAPLPKDTTGDRDETPRKSLSTNNSPTRLSVPAGKEARRSSDIGQSARKSSLSRQGPKSLSRSSSIKNALGSKQGLSSFASMMSGQAIEALIRGKRRSRRNTQTSSKGRASSVPTSPTRSASQSPARPDQTKTNVTFQEPKWSGKDGPSQQQNVQSDNSATLPRSDDRTGSASGPTRPGPRRISFGTLPARSVASKDSAPSTPNEPAKGEPEARRISFGVTPSRSSEVPVEKAVPEHLEDEDEYEDIDDDEEYASDEASEDDPEANDRREGQPGEHKRTRRRPVKAIPRPTFTLGASGGEKLPPKKVEVHPSNSFSSRKFRDDDNSSSSSSEYEDMDDIRRAQRLAINLSTVDTSIEHRSIRTIIRGDYSSMQDEAEQGHRRARTYLVATDLSGEAAYALEWTIGTVLRDGDTLIAVYAVDQELGTGALPDADAPSLPVGQGGAAIQETQATIGRLTDATKASSGTEFAGPRKSLPPPTNRNATKAEQERVHAIDEISQTCIKFLRKTKLQVRVGIEVVHCESPRYMITEAIDELEPTMVIVGSRGQSALKGVLLGSFSNYLVMKSSAPVMVARKKLRTADSKQKATKMRLSNNLSANKRPLSEARID